MLDKTIIKNISSLFSIRVAGYIIPLITLPYLVRVLGVEGYGSLGFALAVTQYSVLFINYGFDLSATSAIAKVRDDKKKVSAIFWNILSIRLIIWFLSYALLLIVSLASDAIFDIQTILMAYMLLSLASVLFPQWLFQGKEKLGLISLIKIATQTLSVPLLFIFVENESDLSLAALISALAPLASALCSLWIVYKRKWIIYKAPSLINIKKQLIDGWYIFISTAAISLYTTNVTVILGLISGPVSVGYFVAAERLIKAVLGLYGIISNAFYPRINAVVESSKKEAIELIKKLGIVLFGSAIICSIAVYFSSGFIVVTLFGVNYGTAEEILKILSLLPIVISVSNLMGIQILIPFGYKKEFSKVLITSACASLFLLIPFVYKYAEYGAAVSVLITELIVTIMMIYTVFKLRIVKVKDEI
ncbi:flippase [Enterovibrio norvegicus]|uniref:Polysaccharide biosynthesis protein n=1 Tax=Enterovibrio norvegicus TaxID=188144 RepID=A0A2N7LDN9_9GAMM|nr:flippase [Enterovibrio norvegicus]PML75580.1 polysaccharide biosynthesis protein [Enterovibrio norvegicus]PMN93498.1 polysaccharide biosynthesis protein [Enterovibrio norvegicus]